MTCAKCGGAIGSNRLFYVQPGAGFIHGYPEDCGVLEEQKSSSIETFKELLVNLPQPERQKIYEFLHDSLDCRMGR